MCECVRIYARACKSCCAHLPTYAAVKRGAGLTGARCCGIECTASGGLMRWWEGLRVVAAAAAYVHLSCCEQEYIRSIVCECSVCVQQAKCSTVLPTILYDRTFGLLWPVSAGASQCVTPFGLFLQCLHDHMCTRTSCATANLHERHKLQFLLLRICSPFANGCSDEMTMVSVVQYTQ
eukprot:10304-Heterococcus_DN1.PRE.2